MKSDMTTLLKLMIEKRASDLHITAGATPQLRIDERLLPTDYDKITPTTSKELAYSMLSKDQIEAFERDRELDMSFGIKNLSF